MVTYKPDNIFFGQITAHCSASETENKDFL